ncbi:hypothetical protein [Nocardioides sambongensis]|uniref:hypothetical protein n=1 Tax=Nocardioides sambongensis TaxID=2589074 RepID=UPI00112BF540|nr:hypothetical protein [Nocardioides sambongensis]
MRIGRSLALATCAALLGVSATAATGATASAAADGVDLGGAPVSGSVTDRANPAEVGPGVWSDTLGGTGSGNDEHFFRYQRRIADSTVHVGVVGAPEGTASDAIGLSVRTADTDCGSGTGSGAYAVPDVLMGTSVVVGGDDPRTARTSACAPPP